MQPCCIQFHYKQQYQNMHTQRLKKNIFCVFLPQNNMFHYIEKEQLSISNLGQFSLTA